MSHDQEGSENLIGLETVNESKGGRDNYERVQALWKHANAMHMMLWDEMHDMNKIKIKDRNLTTEKIIYHIAGNGKSWSYKYGKLHPGRYNTPPLQEDLVPRSRMAPKGKGRGR